MGYLRKWVSVNVRYYRERHGFSQAYLAEAAELTDGMIAQVESGKSTLSIDSLERVAEVLQVLPSDIVMRPEDRDKFYQEVIDDSFINEMKIFLNKRAGSKNSQSPTDKTDD